MKPDRTIFKGTDRTNRTRTRLKDDLRLYLADDLDIAPDGKIYFSEATTRYELADWALDGLKGAATAASSATIRRPGRRRPSSRT